MLNLLTPSSPLYPLLARTLWSPPEQNAHTPSFLEGPSPVNKTTPIS